MRTYEIVTERAGKMVKVTATGGNIRSALRNIGLKWEQVVTVHEVVD